MDVESEFSQLAELAKKGLLDWCKPKPTTVAEIAVVTAMLGWMERYRPPCHLGQEQAFESFFLLREGRFFTPGKLPDKYRQEGDASYDTVQNLALVHRELKYVVGLGFRLKDEVPRADTHAWCVTKKGEVVDPISTKPGVAYLGVAFKTAFLKKHVASEIDVGGCFPILGPRYYYYGHCVKLGAECVPPGVIGGLGPDEGVRPQG